jgi:DNA-binding IclR family transcriptional regulator
MDKTLLKGLQILEVIADTKGEPRKITELAAQVGLTRSNVHRTLQTLVHAGFVEKDLVDGGYRGTMKMLSLGVRQLGELDIRSVAPPFMAKLVQETGESTMLAVLSGLSVVYIDKIDSFQPVSAFVLVGNRTPAHVVASGKVLLAAQGPAYWKDLPALFARFAPTVDVDVEALKVQLAKIRRAGYAVNRGDYREGAAAMAAPVFNSSARPVASLGVYAPVDRLGPARVKEIAPLLVNAAGEFSKALGYRPKANERDE